MSTLIDSRAVRSAILAGLVLVLLAGKAHAGPGDCDACVFDADATVEAGDASVADEDSSLPTVVDSGSKASDAGDSGPVVETGDYTGGGSFSECSAVPGVAAASGPWLIVFAAALVFRRTRRSTRG